MLEILLDLVVNRQRLVRILFRLAKNMIRALAAKHVSDQHAVLSEDERIQRQRVLLLVLRNGDLFSAARTIIAVVHPPSFNGGAKLHLSLSEELVKKFLDLFILHIDDQLRLRN